MLAVHTVAGAQTVEAVTLHHARGALALADAGHVDDLVGREDVGGQFLAQGVLAGIGGPDLDEVLARGDPGLARSGPRPAW